MHKLTPRLQQLQSEFGPRFDEDVGLRCEPSGRERSSCPVRPTTERKRRMTMARVSQACVAIVLAAAAGCSNPQDKPKPDVWNANFNVPFATMVACLAAPPTAVRSAGAIVAFVAIVVLGARGAINAWAAPRHSSTRVIIFAVCSL